MNLIGGNRVRNKDEQGIKDIEIWSKARRQIKWEHFTLNIVLTGVITAAGSIGFVVVCPEYKSDRNQVCLEGLLASISLLSGNSRNHNSLVGKLGLALWFRH